MFNPRPHVHIVPILGAHNVYVVDDALVHPEQWVERAAEFAREFELTGHNAYPGPELRMPDGVSEKLDEFFAQHIRRLLGARRTLRLYSRLAMVTHAAEQLDPRQWICHRDRMGVPPEQCIAASVLYLFEDIELGGTSFFMPRCTKAEIDLLVHESGTLAADAFTAKYGIPAGYMTESNAWFEKVCTVPPKWNRMIFYDGGLFHCSDIAHPERLSPDPRRGRLTFNGFFTCRRAAI